MAFAPKTSNQRRSKPRGSGNVTDGLGWRTPNESSRKEQGSKGSLWRASHSPVSSLPPEASYNSAAQAEQSEASASEPSKRQEISRIESLSPTQSTSRSPKADGIACQSELVSAFSKVTSSDGTPRSVQTKQDAQTLKARALKALQALQTQKQQRLDFSQFLEAFDLNAGSIDMEDGESYDQLVVSYALYLLMHKVQRRGNWAIWLFVLVLLLCVIALFIGYDYLFSLCYASGQILLANSYAGSHSLY